MAFDATAFREGQRAVWSSGDWPSFAELIQSVSDELVEKLEIEDGMSLLDIGTGSGNLAIPAAQAGAKVTGVDVTPELFDAGRKRASDAGVEVEWIEADAADLPFDDASFDRVASVFGAMFAPVNQQAADEMFRVTKPGGLAINCTWTPDGLNGRFLALAGSKMPPPPDEVQSPVLWGDEDHVRELFDGKDCELSFEKATCEFGAESIEAMMSMMEEKLGPMVMAKKVLEPDDYAEFRKECEELEREFGKETDDGFVAEAEYLRSYIRPK